jgi:hypothetical protein
MCRLNTVYQDVRCIPLLQKGYSVNTIINFNPEDRDDTFLLYAAGHTTLPPKRTFLTPSLPWKPQISKVHASDIYLYGHVLLVLRKLP